MTRTRPFFRLALAIVTALAGSARAAEYKPIVLDRNYDHDRYLTRPVDVVREVRAYVVSFDGPDDDDGNGEPA